MPPGKKRRRRRSLTGKGKNTTTTGSVEVEQDRKCPRRGSESSAEASLATALLLQVFSSLKHVIEAMQDPGPNVI